MSRSTHARAILGPELYGKLGETRVLLVGAGGIGCELLKTVLLTGFGHITILDLDTIDLSNLNRQFLFRKKDVKQPKAIVAAASAGPFNPSCSIEPIQANIFDPRFDATWFRSFDIVLNALDNLEARQQVNRMCIIANVPLVESGTAGYYGQVQPIVKDRSECFACMPKETPKSFPVCTIRSTPSTPIHCIVWAKSYLFNQLFGESGDDEAEFDEALRNGENAEEIEKLRTEAHAFANIRSSLIAPNGPALVFDKIFNEDIRRLLTMSDMWRTRTPPVPLEYTAIRAGTFEMPVKKRAHAPVRPPSTPKKGSAANGKKHAAGHTNGKVEPTEGLKDRKELTLLDNVELFANSLQRLAERQASSGQPLSFDKDDDDALDFVTATANLRATCYSIPNKTRWEVKEMAGNIIPAIATTNAIISGLIVLQALHLLRRDYQKSRSVFLQTKPGAPLGHASMMPPNPHCETCRDVYLAFPCDPTRAVLGDVLKAVGVKRADDDDDHGREAGAWEGTRLVYDPYPEEDQDDTWEKTLADLGVIKGKRLSVVDEASAVRNLVLVIEDLPPNYSPEDRPFILPDVLPTLPPKPPPPAPTEPNTPAKGLKRRAPDDEDGDEPPSKRLKLDSGFKLEGGVLVLDDDDDVVDDPNATIELD